MLPNGHEKTGGLCHVTTQQQEIIAHEIVFVWSEKKKQGEKWTPEGNNTQHNINNQVCLESIYLHLELDVHLNAQTALRVDFSPSVVSNKKFANPLPKFPVLESYEIL